MAVSARSNVGPITFTALGIEGYVEAAADGAAVLGEPSPAACIRFRLDELTSGNVVYDTELRQRLDTRRYPMVVVRLREAVPIGDGHFAVSGEATIHEVSRTVSGIVAVSADPSGRLRFSGEQAFDVRDFGITAPNVLLFRILPDVRVLLSVEAEDVGDAIRPQAGARTEHRGA